MIHIFIGTKAQFIKMVPVMMVLNKKNINFNLIDLGQHSLLTRKLRDEFAIKSPDVYVSQGENISSLFKGLAWCLLIFYKGIKKTWVQEKVFLNKKGVCLIHGDTVSTLLGLYLAKRADIKVIHIESGLRSYNYWEPFPEEILRLLIMRFSDRLIAPSEWSLNNLKKMGLREKSTLISGNTSLETTMCSLDKKVELEFNIDKFALITVHRMENILLKRRMQMVVELIKNISDELSIVFVQHQPTIKQLKKFGLQGRLEKIKNVYFFKILSHKHFIHLLNRCEFVITDGGSIQEESYYLDKPCLLLRNCTERIEGLGENVVLSKFCKDKIRNFIDNYKNFKRKECIKKNIKPSEQIIKYLDI